MLNSEQYKFKLSIQSVKLLYHAVGIKEEESCLIKYVDYH